MEKGQLQDTELASIAARHASGMMDDYELFTLGKALASVLNQPQKDDYVIEIGAYVGATTQFMVDVMRAAERIIPILSIDPFERVIETPGNPAGSSQRYLRAIRASDAEAFCFPLLAFSQHCHSILRPSVGLLIVDGDHSYESCRNDLTLYLPKVRPGGFVLVDDYSVESYPGVVKAVDECLNPATIIEKSWFVLAQMVPAYWPA